jgi:hypothetical protein
MPHTVRCPSPSALWRHPIRMSFRSHYHPVASNISCVHSRNFSANPKAALMNTASDFGRILVAVHIRTLYILTHSQELNRTHTQAGGFCDATSSRSRRDTCASTFPLSAGKYGIIPGSKRHYRLPQNRGRFQSCLHLHPGQWEQTCG